MGRLTTGDRVWSRPCDVPGRPAFANSVILGFGPRILEARSRTKNSLVIWAGIASLGCAQPRRESAESTFKQGSACDPSGMGRDSYQLATCRESVL